VDQSTLISEARLHSRVVRLYDEINWTIVKNRNVSIDDFVDTGHSALLQIWK